MRQTSLEDRLARSVARWRFACAALVGALALAVGLGLQDSKPHVLGVAGTGHHLFIVWSNGEVQVLDLTGAQGGVTADGVPGWRWLAIDHRRSGGRVMIAP